MHGEACLLSHFPYRNGLALCGMAIDANEDVALDQLPLQRRWPARLHLRNLQTREVSRQLLACSAACAEVAVLVRSASGGTRTWHFTSTIEMCVVSVERRM